MTAPTPRFAALGPGPTSNPAITARFPSLEALLAEPAFDLLELTASPEQNADWVHQLRRHPAYGLTLIYCQGDPPPTAALADGPLPAHPASALQQWRERLAVFNRGQAPEGPQAQVLAYLWLRAPGSLKALRSPRSPALYHYPLVDALGDDQLNGHALVQGLAQRNLLDSTTLVDRIRLCRSCGSGHLNYVDVCVECSALDIVRQPSLHCFTCGHVGAQADYLKDGVLVCPNCLTRLRHIGTDYDRPLENYSCQACSAFFVDADIQARCLDCGQQHAPDELLVRNIHDYRLSEAGLLAARQGLDQGFDPYFGGLSLVGVNTFRTLLDWQLELIARHGEPSFALLGVRFKNLGAALARLGPQRGHALLDALIERIQVAIRDTDRCTRTTEEHLWLLLMYTDSVGLQRVTERLNQISELFVGQDLQDIVLTTSGCVAPAQLVEKENAELLMARLAGEL
ncbi:diguanylate cyclase [Pantoea sp. Tr-811]|uniref:TackOD1 domain-containing metal-binding protein n=1 Tax=Pantoea sp. Tr-811 TaxID=2608361 RepID=UPI001420459A|nr:diguanylate cyclase [Pantoea sp. Tr-811]NIF24880.1 diguanylate cyclase [Pantoea sp. Tr-811]